METNRFSLTNVALATIVLLAIFLVGILIFGPNTFQAMDADHTVNATAATQDKHAKKPTPDEILKLLKEGNERFFTGQSSHPHADAARLALAGTENQGDHAYATIISCSDSRVPVELIFDAGVMDMFVIRVAGNVIDTDEAGTVEYGLAHVYTPVFLVLGHSQCGAVTAVAHKLEGVGHKLEINIPALVDNIIPAVERAKELHKDVHGDEIIPYAIEENVWQAIEDLFMQSPTARTFVKEGKIKVVGAIYDVGTGHIEWLDTANVDEILNRVEASPDKQTKTFADN
jgi:carbonic anhydrase